MVDFCHIAPTPLLSTFVNTQTHHLLLAHLVEEDKEYTSFYQRGRTSADTYILDNSAFEMFKQGREMYPSDKLLEMGVLVGAEYIVMSDYPNEPGSKTIKAAEQLAPMFRKARFGTFFVPQSEIGDIEDYIATFAWAATSPLVDYIGVSILGVPNAYGVEKGNNLQRYMSRFRMMCELEQRGILRLARRNGKKIHFLGMVDGPNEIQLCGRFDIDTWDSSAAIWTGLNDIAFDNSPTGLVDGKYEKEVDFNYNTLDKVKIDLAKSNMKYINDLCGEYANEKCEAASW
tara:strand:+ start:143 stop:1003 length:861 start_codon:yes stop_codon:yes gene_type:complete